MTRPRIWVNPKVTVSGGGGGGPSTGNISIGPEFGAGISSVALSVGEVTASVVQKAVPRSGTPDTDSWGDAWTDATVGQTGVNHGNEAALHMNGTVVKAAYLHFDLTSFPANATGAAHTFVYRQDNPNLVTGTPNASFGPSALGGGLTRPFTESTLTDSNKPANPTAVSKTMSGPLGVSTQTVTFTDAEMNLLLAKWVLARISIATLQVSDYLVSGREDVDANKPVLTFKTILT